jgi:hypothetical protein
VVCCRHSEKETVRLWREPAGTDEKPSTDDPENSTAPTAQEVYFEIGVILCVALGAALIAQLLLGGL